MLKQSFFAVFFLGVVLLFGCSTIDNRKLSNNKDRLQSVRGLAGSKDAILIGPHAEFVPVKAGKFEMGSPDDEFGHYENENLHEVLLTKDFEIQTTEVTQRQWFYVMGDNPSRFKPVVVRESVMFFLERDRIDDDYCPKTAIINIIKRSYTLCPDHPVESVSWDDVQRFIEKLNKSSQVYVYRLPTEAEWEYAAREGGRSTTPFNLGESISPDKVNYHSNRNRNRYSPYNSMVPHGLSRGQTVAVGSLGNRNALGIFDMHGNVGEWVQDWYGKYPKSGPRSFTKDPKGPSRGWTRLIRGGSWVDVAGDTRSAYRESRMESGYSSHTGFRLVRTFKE